MIPAAGKGARFGATRNKVFADLWGRPLLGWTLEAFAQSPSIAAVVLIGHTDELNELRHIGETYGGGKLLAVIEGGTDRQTSVRNGLAACDGFEYVVVHDGARPCVTPELVSLSVIAARTFGATTAAVPVVDTLVRGTDSIFDGPDVARDGLYAIQTPQAFRRDLLLRAHEQAVADSFTGTDDAGLVRRIGGTRHHFPGSPENLKVTRPEDLRIAAAILAGRLGENPPSDGTMPFEESQMSPATNDSQHDTQHQAPDTRFRIGHGYDVHAFADNRSLYLGGVHFPDAPRGLEGHSDADVVLHAVCDALLGAAGLGDIGKLFPPSDMRHKNRPSMEFLREVKARLDADGWRVANVDVTVLAETPKIGPYAEQMQMGIAVVLGITPGAVGIKATTNEKMGFVGRSEGIAAHAVALLVG